MNERRKKRAASLWRFTVLNKVADVVFIPLVLWVVSRYFVTVSSVAGPSMVPTLENGERMAVQIVNCHPEQGDIVVARSPWNGRNIVKRAIATGGQHVSIDYDAGEVRVDDVVLGEPYIKEEMLALGDGHVTELNVPEDSYFLMGDNRNISRDSRDPELGAVPSEDIVGRCALVFFPLFPYP